MDPRHHFCVKILVVIALHFSRASCDPDDSCTEKMETCNVGLIRNSTRNIIGCMPCSQEYLTASYFDNCDSLLDSDFHSFLTQRIGSDDLCKGLVDNTNVLVLSELKRKLIGGGSHRNLVSTIRFDLQLNSLNWTNDSSCEAIIIERLPIGVFADPFELQHLVERKVFQAAAVYGDTNLELPSALSNRSIVEIHMGIECNFAPKSCETVVQLPLHARYPPLDTSGYARVAIGNPDLFLRCKLKNLQNETCSWAVSNLGSESNSVLWRIPCGDAALTGIVSSATFGSALLCSLTIVFSAICFSGNNEIKARKRN